MNDKVSNSVLGVKPKYGWKMVKFGEVVKNANLVERDPESNGVERIVGLEHIDPENLHIRRWNSIADGTSFTRKFVPGQTLFGKRRAYQRKVAYAEFEGICSGDILTFETKNRKVLLPELLPFICQSDAFFDHALGTSAGSLSPRTSWTALKDFEFPLLPLDEQKRIAEILWAADEAFEYWKTCQAESDDAYRLDMAARLNAGGSGWDEKPIGQLCSLSNGRGFKSSEWAEKGYPIIRIQNLNGSREFNHFNGELEERWLVRPGQLLYAWAGVKGMSFGPRIWDGPTGGLNQHIFKIEPNSGIGKRWLFEILQLITSEVEKDAHGFKKELVHIRKSWLTEHLVPVPPEEERKNIEKIAHKWDNARKTIAVHIDALSELRRSIINAGLTTEGLHV